MAFARSTSSFVMAMSLCLALIAVQHTAEARTIRGAAPTAAAAIVSSSSSSAGSLNRKLFAAPNAAVMMAKAADSALPADAYVMASPCPAATAAPGSSATAVFTVGSSVNPQVFKDVSLQVDFPKALLASSNLKCHTSTAQAIDCDAPPMSAADMEGYDVVSTSCMLGDLAVTGPVTCTFSYSVPATPLPTGIDARQILGAITYAPLADHVAENALNNAAVTCAVSA